MNWVPYLIGGVVWLLLGFAIYYKRQRGKAAVLTDDALRVLGQQGYRVDELNAEYNTSLLEQAAGNIPGSKIDEIV